MKIEDGLSGRSATVNTENRVDVQAVMENRESHANRHDGLAFHVLFGVNPDGAADVFFYLKNDSDKDLIVEGVWIQTSAAEEVQVRIGDTGTAVKTNGADLTPVNLNAGSNLTAEVTCYGETSDAAVDITGLVAGRLVEVLYLTSVASVYFNFEQDLIIPKNQTFTLIAVGGDTLLRGTVVFYFHE